MSSPSSFQVIGSEIRSPNRKALAFLDALQSVGGVGCVGGLELGAPPQRIWGGGIVCRGNVGSRWNGYLHG